MPLSLSLLLWDPLSSTEQSPEKKKQHKYICYIILLFVLAPRQHLVNIHHLQIIFKICLSISDYCPESYVRSVMQVTISVSIFELPNQKLESWHYCSLVTVLWFVTDPIILVQFQRKNPHPLNKSQHRSLRIDFKRSLVSRPI